MSRTHIVAVDDDRRILRILKHACECVGYKVHCVQDAKFFESALLAFEPSLVFLDLNMRNIDGIELLRFIAEERPGTSVIVTSGVEPRLLNAAHHLGVSIGLNMLEPIPKPLMIADVRQRLKHYNRQPTSAVATSFNIQTIHTVTNDLTVELSYQPMINLKSRQVVCVEALAQIHHPREGLLDTEQFFNIAESHDLTEPLTIDLLRTALRDFSHWGAAAADLQLAVNLSQNLLLDTGFANRLDGLLREAAVQPKRLMLEIVERGEISDRRKLSQSLTQLSKLGVSLSLNHFGSNISSLSHVYEFPYQTLKLDKQFAIHALNNENAAAMIRSSLDLAKSVGLRVAVEGIQSEDTLRWLGNLGCELGQGRCISAAMTAGDFCAWLRVQKRPGGAHNLNRAKPQLRACEA